MSGKVTIGVTEPRASAAGFVAAWERAERGEGSGAAEVRLHFEDLETLLRALTGQRWALLRVLRATGPCSVRALARELRRDYKNVHTDVGVLEGLGLVARTPDGRIEVPWDVVTAELTLAA